MGSQESQVEDRYGWFDVPDGNLTAMAEDESGSLAIGIMSIFWVFWIAASMFIPWPNTTTYEAPIWYLWRFTGNFSLFTSYMPWGYITAWIINLALFFVELFAWMINGTFYVYWATICMWLGFFLAAIPVVLELLYIYIEYPANNSEAAWPFTFYSGEFILLFFQGLFWFTSFLLHVIFLGQLERMVNSKRALALGITSSCVCVPCRLPKFYGPADGAKREAAEVKCKAACNKKCPENADPCPLEKYEDESAESYSNRCKTASELAQLTAAGEDEARSEQEDDSIMEGSTVEVSVGDMETRTDEEVDALNDFNDSSDADVDW